MVAGGLKTTNEEFYEIIMKGYANYKIITKNNNKKTTSCEKFYRNCLQDKVFDEKQSETLCKVFTKYENRKNNDPSSEQNFWTKNFVAIKK